jgi:hypothetical protein
MIISGKVKKAVKQQAPDVVIESQCWRPMGLRPGGFRGNQDVAKVVPVALKGKDIGRLIHSSIAMIVGAHHLIRDEYDGKLSRGPTHRRGEGGNETADSRSVDRVFTLLVQKS